MKTIKLFLLLNVFAHAGTFGAAFGAAFDTGKTGIATMIKTEIMQCPGFDQPTYPLLDVAKVAAINEVALAAGIELSDIKSRELVSSVRVAVSGGLQRALTHVLNHAIIVPAVCEDTVRFIKRCAATYNAMPAQYKNCFLAECDTVTCPATRSTKPAVRATFERMIGDAVAPRYVETYCAFASGGLLQDVRLLEQLRDRDKKIRTVVIVDTSYRELINVLSGEESAGFHVPAHQSVHELVDYANLKNKGFSFKDLLKVNARAKIIQQFSENVASLYPETFEGLYVYADAEAYVRDCQRSFALRADLLVGCDIKHSDMVSLNQERQSAWDDYHNIEGHGLGMSAIAALLTTGWGVAQNRVYMRVKATTGMQTQRCVSDPAGIRVVSEHEQKDLEDQVKESLELLIAGK